jgi:hypothetical protein
LCDVSCVNLTTPLNGCSWTRLVTGFADFEKSEIFLLVNEPQSYLVPRLRLGTQCLAGSACGFRQPQCRVQEHWRGRASKTVRSKAEPWNEWFASRRSARSVDFLLVNEPQSWPEIVKSQGRIASPLVARDALYLELSLLASYNVDVILDRKRLNKKQSADVERLGEIFTTGCRAAAG